MGFLLFAGESHAFLRPYLGHIKQPKESLANQTSELKKSTRCSKIIDFFEKKHNIPNHLLHSIAAIESRKSPWAVYAVSRSHFFRSKDAAVSFIKKMRAQGVKNINIGCMQLDVRSHARRFKCIDDMLSPYHNIEFAARLLKKLYRIHGSWANAVRYYHSAESCHNVKYKNRVFALCAKARGESYVHSTSNHDPRWLVATEKSARANA